MAKKRKTRRWFRVAAVLLVVTALYALSYGPITRLESKGYYLVDNPTTTRFYEPLRWVATVSGREPLLYGYTKWWLPERAEGQNVRE